MPSCLRRDAGAKALAHLRGYLATLREQGLALLTALALVCAGQPSILCCPILLPAAL
jgi:hypothetical protein